MDIIDFPLERRRPAGNPLAIGGTTGARPRRDERESVTTCLHERLTVGVYLLDVCPGSGEAAWLDDGDVVDPAEALARLFGNFDLRTAMPGLDAPGDTVLVYSPDGRRGRAAMRSLPACRWIEGAPGLWLTHDGEHLLMSPVDRLLTENLIRDL